MVDDSEHDEESRLLDDALRGDPQATGVLLERHRARLQRMVNLRIDRRLRGRVDPTDIVQEAYVDAIRRLPEYAEGPTMPFFIWLRFLTVQRLVDEHRRHLGARARDADRELHIDGAATLSMTTAALAARLLGRLTSPSEAAIRIERKARLHEALERMDPVDREILVLRHFEMLTNDEVAATFGLKKSAASRRYTRALVRLKDRLASGGDEPGTG